MLPSFLGDMFRGNEGKNVSPGKASRGKQRHGSIGGSTSSINISNSSTSSGAPGIKRNTSFSVKNTKYNNSAVSVATLQRVKSFCDYIQLFCSMTDGKFELREIEIIIHNPVFIDTNLLETMTPHVTAFANILRIAQTEPQDWFDFVVHRKTENGAAPEICFNEFETELLKLCSEVGHSPLSEEALQTLFNFIKGNRSDDCFGLWELAIAFAKFRLPAAKIRSANIVASQFRNFAMFLKAGCLGLQP